MADKSEDEWMSLPEDVTQLTQLYGKKKYHPAMNMAYSAMNMKRSPKQAFILLVGLSGAGKSSTVNVMFETNVAEVGDKEATTRSTTEYIVRLKSDEWRIPDLPLSIIDTPGFNDTDGLEQDAKNIMSIKKFLRSHPALKDNYPNLVMIILDIQDSRIHGASSNFTKMLKGISTVNAIDRENPNVVVVLTHAASIAFDKDIWEEEVKTKKAQVDAIVRAQLGVDPVIVVQENQPKRFNLKQVRDWYLLPNGDKQPKILFKACTEILKKTSDYIGHEAVTVFFRPQQERKTVQVGICILSSEVEMDDYKKMYNILLQAVVMDFTSEIGKMLDDHKKKTNDVRFIGDILVLQVRFRDLDISKKKELLSMTMNRLRSKLFPTRITQHMKVILKEVFNLADEKISGIDNHVGKGYNIFTDSVTQCSPLVMQANDENGLPSNVDIIHEPSLELKCQTVKGTSDYVKQRLKELKVCGNAEINLWNFNFEPRAGYNDMNRFSESKTANMDTSSFSIEHKIKKVVIQQPFQISQDFKDDVKHLPTVSDMDLENSIMRWKAFFEKWGMYVVTGAYLGGSLTGQVKVEKTESTNSVDMEANAALSIKLGFLGRSQNLMFSNKAGEELLKKGMSKIHSKSLKWHGGISANYTKSLEDITPNEWKNWVESLDDSPVPLFTSLDLYPTYQLASMISRRKGTQMQKVMNLSLKGDFDFEEEEEEDDDRTTTAVSIKSQKCFHEDSLVMLHNRKLMRMKDLSVGDKILIANSSGTFSQDEVIAWLHQVRDGQFTFIQIVHELGEITLTSEHIVFVGKSQKSQQASTLKPGDELSFYKNNDDCQAVTMTKVLSISKVYKRGIYAPLTYSGRLLVDKVSVSCYCTLNPLTVIGKEIISSHALAHAGFLPLRLAFKFGVNINSNKLNDKTGIHGYAQWLMSVILGE